MMIRVLVAESSAGMRDQMIEILQADPSIEVVGGTTDGITAVSMAKRLRPDVVIMGATLPKLNGFAATKQIMIEAPTPIVIVSGGERTDEVEHSVLALRAGALTVLPRPTGSNVSDSARSHFISTVTAMSQVKVVRHWRRSPVASVHKIPRQAPSGSATTRVVAIAASTGGPAALQRLLSDLPPDFSTPILVVQHIARGFIGGFVGWLNTVCSLEVRIASDGARLEPNTVYVAADDRHLGVSGRSKLALSSAAPIAGFRPSATFLFESVADAFGEAALAVMLTGMGQDGVAGLRRVKAQGGRVVAQDESTSVVFGMPGAAINAGLVDQVLPLGDIAFELVAATRG